MGKIFIAFWTACMTMAGVACMFYDFKIGNNEVGIIVCVVALWSMEAGRRVKDWENTRTTTTGTNAFPEGEL